MSTVFAWFAILVLILSLGASAITIYYQSPARSDWLRLTEILFSWQVIAGGLAAATFSDEIKALLMRGTRMDQQSASAKEADPADAPRAGR